MQVLTKMTEAISGEGGGGNAGGGFDDDEDNESAYSRDEHSLDTQDEAPNLLNNIRIKSKKFLREADAEEEALLDSKEEYDEDALHAAAAAEKEDVAVAAAAAAAVAKDREIAEGGGISGVGGGAGVDEKAAAGKVPSRLAVKKFSATLNMEAKRKEEMETRRKRCVFICCDFVCPCCVLCYVSLSSALDCDSTAMIVLL